MSGTSVVRIAEALSRPLLMHPTKLEVILGAIGNRLNGLELEAAPPIPDASRFVGTREGGRPYRTQGGIAFIPIIGSLANRGAYIGASSGITSYEGVGAQFRMAADDSSVHSVVMDIDSPGGEATGMFRLANLVRQIRATKRIVAFVDDMAASAAYGIASQAHEIVVSPSSIVGSIGVVLTHVDRSAEMEKAGRKVTLIHAGAHKVDGHPFGPLSEQVRSDLQNEVLGFYSQFLDTVVAGRPRLTRKAAQETEAKTFIGQAAIAAGLADRIGTLDSVVADLLTRHHSKARNRSGNVDMTTITGTFNGANLAAALTASLAAGAPDPTGALAAFAAAGAPSLSQAQVDAARVEGETSGKAAGAQAERERIAAIVGSEEGKANPAAALELALDADMSGLPVAAVTKVLKHAGPATTPAATAPTTPPAPASPEQRHAENPLGLMNPAAGPKGDAPKTSGLAAAVDALISAEVPGGRH